MVSTILGVTLGLSLSIELPPHLQEQPQPTFIQCGFGLYCCGHQCVCQIIERNHASPQALGQGLHFQYVLESCLETWLFLVILEEVLLLKVGLIFLLLFWEQLQIFFHEGIAFLDWPQHRQQIEHLLGHSPGGPP